MFCRYRYCKHNTPVQDSAVSSGDNSMFSLLNHNIKKYKSSKRIVISTFKHFVIFLRFFSASHRLCTRTQKASGTSSGGWPLHIMVISRWVQIHVMRIDFNTPWIYYNSERGAPNDATLYLRRSLCARASFKALYKGNKEVLSRGQILKKMYLSRLFFGT